MAEWNCHGPSLPGGTSGKRNQNMQERVLRDGAGAAQCLQFDEVHNYRLALVCKFSLFFTISYIMNLIGF